MRTKERGKKDMSKMSFKHIISSADPLCMPASCYLYCSNLWIENVHTFSTFAHIWDCTDITDNVNICIANYLHAIRCEAARFVGGWEGFCVYGLIKITGYPFVLLLLAHRLTGKQGGEQMLKSNIAYLPNRIVVGMMQRNRPITNVRWTKTPIRSTMSKSNIWFVDFSQLFVHGVQERIWM